MIKNAIIALVSLGATTAALAEGTFRVPGSDIDTPAPPQLETPYVTAKPGANVDWKSYKPPAEMPSIVETLVPTLDTTTKMADEIPQDTSPTPTSTAKPGANIDWKNYKPPAEIPSLTETLVPAPDTSKSGPKKIAKSPIQDLFATSALPDLPAGTGVLSDSKGYRLGSEDSTSRR